MGRRQTTLLGDDPVVQFALRLRSARGSAQLTLRQLAQRSGYAHSTLATAEAGRALPRWCVVEAFARACDADPAQLRTLWSAAGGGAPLPHPETPTGSPAQLPQRVPRLSGRDGEIRRLTELTTPSENSAGPPTRTIVIDGSAGVGKTALALYFAGRVLDRYPDGHLYVDLRGFDPCRPPLPPGEALDHLLTSIGTDPAAIPRDLDQKAARYRTAFATRRSILLLDDAASVEQLRPLLPGHSASLVLVTSRHQLAGLGVRDNARHIGLDLLDRADSIDLLRYTLADGAECAPSAVLTELAELCGDLPLALRIAGHRIAGNPTFTVAGFTRELARTDDRLGWLRVPGDPASDLPTALERSYRALGADAARMFRLLASYDEPVISAQSAAVRSELPLETGRQLLEDLAEAHLVEHVGPWRYRLQYLLGLFGRSVGRRHDH